MEVVEEGLQEERSGYLIDEVFALEAMGGGLTLAAGVQKGVSVAGGEPLVEEVVSESGMLGEEGGGEGFGFGRLGARGAVGMEGKTGDESGDVELADPAGDGF